MNNTTQSNWQFALRMGALAGIVSLGVSVIGMVDAFSQRDLVSGIFSLGQLLLFASAFGTAYVLARRAEDEANQTILLKGAVIGLLASPLLVLLVIIGSATDLREIGLVNVSPNLIENLLVFGQPMGLGLVLLVAVSAIAGVLGAGTHLISDRLRSPIITGVIWMLGVGMMSEILSTVLRPLLGNNGIRFLFKTKALTPVAAVIIFAAAAGISILWNQRADAVKSRVNSYMPADPKQANWVRIGLGIAGLLVLPLILGTYLSEVVNNVGLYILMGLGLNIVVGFAGLLDLGYVAFFAIGAYTVGVLTSGSSLGVDAGFTFWTALPIAVGISVLFGIILGIPVLRMRGDYLAIVTLGFGEIIRILATSDFLKSYIGGAQGILQIPKAMVGGTELVRPQQLYYLILAACLLGVFVSIRFRDSRLGRQWMAMREDEDVAEAMGIDLVKTKLMAFATGAAFSGLSGAIFASKLSSIFPHSFNLIISINVLSLIIVGGMGSLPGVAIGALFLVGLPELLREFAEYRFLMYGVLLIVMMLARPEGLLPSAVRKRELHLEDMEAAAE